MEASGIEAWPNRTDLSIGPRRSSAVQGQGFTTTYKIQGCCRIFAPKDVPASVRSQFAQESLTLDPPKDTYWEGKQLGTLTTLAGVAEALSDTPNKPRPSRPSDIVLSAWLTFDGEQDAEHFYYDPSWGTLIGTPPSYGSDDQINDHHFHYGYFIRAAAEVARFDPDWAAEWGPRVELLIRDVASIVPNDPLFPRLRHFDPYAGHSWASGHAIFGDGNNQESSSEAMNAWYGIALWGAATGNTELLDLGLYLYNTELVAIEEYWFDVDQTNFADGFPKPSLASFGVEKTTTPLGSPRKRPHPWHQLDPLHTGLPVLGEISCVRQTESRGHQPRPTGSECSMARPQDHVLSIRGC